MTADDQAATQLATPQATPLTAMARDNIHFRVYVNGDQHAAIERLAGTVQRSALVIAAVARIPDPKSSTACTGRWPLVFDIATRRTPRIAGVPSLVSVRASIPPATKTILDGFRELGYHVGPLVREGLRPFLEIRDPDLFTLFPKICKKPKAEEARLISIYEERRQEMVALLPVELQAEAQKNLDAIPVQIFVKKSERPITPAEARRLEAQTRVALKMEAERFALTDRGGNPIPDNVAPMVAAGRALYERTGVYDVPRDPSGAILSRYRPWHAHGMHVWEADLLIPPKPLTVDPELPPPEAPPPPAVGFDLSQYPLEDHDRIRQILEGRAPPEGQAADNGAYHAPRSEADQPTADIDELKARLRRMRRGDGE